MKKGYLWKRCPQGSLRAVNMASQQMAQSSSLAASSSAVATANLHIKRHSDTLGFHQIILLDNKIKASHHLASMLLMTRK